MARHLFEHSYDTRTLTGCPVTFKDGCKGILSGASLPFAHVDSLPAWNPGVEHSHSYEMAWETVAWRYIDTGKDFPNN